MKAIEETLKNSKKIVVKIGSNVLSNEDGVVDREILNNIVNQVAWLKEQGKNIIIVSSGAGICGVGAINRWSRKDDIMYKQALCAIGQVELMMAYKEYFKEHGIHVAQMLMTREDFAHDHRTVHMRNTMFTLLDEGVVPIVNENDTVGVEEIKIGDNDTLSALMANLWSADVLVCLSDIDGVFTKDPKFYSDAELVEEVDDVDGLLKDIDVKGKSRFGTGGIASKIEAARKVGEYMTPMILLNGNRKDVIVNAMKGQDKGTIFL